MSDNRSPVVDWKQLLDAVGSGGIVPAGRGGDFVDGNFRRAVGIQQSVGFLIRVGELRVAESRKDLQLADDVQELAVAARQFLRRVTARVTPRAQAIAREG